MVRTHTDGADVVIDAVGGASTKQQSVLAARPGGAAVWIGLHENPMSLNSYDVTLPEMGGFRWLTVGPQDQKDLNLHGLDYIKQKKNEKA